MAYKVFTSDELAQKFLENAQTHILSDSFKNRLTLGNIKTAIENGWGFDMSESNKCVCCDFEYMDEYGEWGRSGEVNMRNFWVQVFATSSLMSMTNPSTHTVNQQISIPVDNMLLSEERVNIKGCCAKIDEALAGKTITVANTGVTSDTQIQINFNSVIRDTATGATPNLIIRTLGSNTLSGTSSPVTAYFDVDADDTTNIKWNARIICTYPSDYVMNSEDLYLTINDTTYQASQFGSSTSTSSTFQTTIENKSINDIANINSIGVQASMAPAPVSTSVLDICDCRITTYPTFLGISGATYLSGNNTVRCRFGASPTSAWNSSVTINATFNYQSSDIMQLIFTNNTLGLINGSTNWWMWVGLPVYVSGVVRTVYLCFNVNNTNSTLVLGNNVCYLNVASLDTSNSGLYITVYGNGDIFLRNDGSVNAIQLITNGSNYTGVLPTYEGQDLVLNRLEISSSATGNLWRTYYNSREYVNGTTIQNSSYNYTEIDIIPNQAVLTFNTLINALYTNQITFGIRS